MTLFGIALIIVGIGLLYHKLKRIKMTLQEILDKVSAQKTIEDGIVQLIAGLKAQIATIPNLSAEQQAAVDAIGTALDTNTAELAEQLTANTPAAS